MRCSAAMPRRAWRPCASGAGRASPSRSSVEVLGGARCARIAVPTWLVTAIKLRFSALSFIPFVLRYRSMNGIKLNSLVIDPFTLRYLRANGSITNLMAVTFYVGMPFETLPRPVTQSVTDCVPTEAMGTMIRFFQIGFAAPLMRTECGVCFVCQT